MDIGAYSYTGPNFNVRVFDSNTKLVIGKFTSIAGDVTILLGGEHPTDTYTTYPFHELWGQIGESPCRSKGDVSIGHDVWIGERATILSGVIIGNGAVVGAGSVVASNVAPYSIVAGNPVRRIGKRWNPMVEWWDWDEERIRVHIDWLTAVRGREA